jgi:hypothetical protein
VYSAPGKFDGEKAAVDSAVGDIPEKGRNLRLFQNPLVFWNSLIYF